MPFQLRPFQHALDAFCKSRPKKKLHEGSEGNYDTEKAYSFTAIGGWSKKPPVTTLYKQKNPLGYSEKVMQDPKALVEYCNFGGAVGTWNAHGSGRWAHAPQDWIIADIELTQEQADDDYEGPGDHVSVIFALWRVEDGYAAGVWRDEDRELLAQVMGLDSWPTEGWQPCKVWYGE